MSGHDAFGTHRVTHVGVVIDDSTSMEKHAKSLVKAFDALIGTLARRSTELNEEVRISVWSFSGEVRQYEGRRGTIAPKDAVKNLIWDIDVLRLPSLAEKYDPYGNTALIDGCIRAIEDMRTIPQQYGDHSFLMFVLTDGEENRSIGTVSQLSGTIRNLPDNWTLGAMVPNTQGVHEARRYGFPNVEIWNTSSADGTSEVGARISAAADTYITTRSAGIRPASTGLFDTSSAAVNENTVKASGMKEADPDSYILHIIPPVTSPFPKAMSRRVKYRIDDYIRSNLGLPFVAGRNYYELIKSETVGPQKDIVLVHRKTGKVYVGREARTLIGLPNETVRLRPSFNDEYFIMIRSDQNNRNMLEGQRLVILK